MLLAAPPTVLADNDLPMQDSLDAFVRHAEPARRPDYVHGRALESLGHAVEYLIDSRMYLGAGGSLAKRGSETARDSKPGRDSDVDQCDAIHLLMRLSREIFLECPEVVPLWARVGRGLKRRLGRAEAVAGTERLSR